ncbi:MAG TPA: sigma-70 family RNA polymerase sigma factor [Gemmataceae bacterium]|nr:sigma-70 family RNA polymerase sigma factor [Gemmataceae bacterium]
MASESLTCVLRYIHQLAETPDERQRSDAELLDRFLAERDETAFRHLVHRHSHMVLSVCRQVLRQREDAEDAFQAVFLILARNAASIRQKTSLASWLHGVAYRTSLKARAEMSKRRQHEKQAAKARAVQPERDWALQELQAVLAEEVARLAEKNRAPFVLCCLEGMSRSEAAQQLGWKEGTVSGRLAEARKRLQARLERRGFTLAAALCASAVGAGTEAAAPPLLLRTTIEAALRIAAGQATKGVVSAPVAALVEGATRALFLSKVKLMGLVLAAAGLVAAAAGSHLHRVLAIPVEGAPATLPTMPAADKPAEKKPTKTAKKDNKIVVQGRVLDPDGKPLAGAQLFFLPTGDEDEAPKTPPDEAKSEADGRFHFAVERSQLVHGRWLAATAKGYALDWIDADKLGANEITLRLAKDMPITGRILSLEGRPVKDASVLVEEVAAPPEGDLSPVLKTIQNDGNNVFAHPLRGCSVGKHCRFLPVMKTDEQGRIRLTGLGKERVIVLRLEGPTIEHQVLYVLTRSKLNVKELVKSAPDRMGGLMRLPAIYGPNFEHLAGPTKPITGIVRDRATGKPLADIHINGSVPGAWWENYVHVKTDKDGRYRIIGLPKARSYHVSV